MVQKLKNNKLFLINDNIKIKKNLLVINENGEKIGPISYFDAKKISKEKNLDLLLVSENDNYLVVKLIDYGKFKYEQKKKEKESKKNQHIIENKEIRLRIGIGIHDIKFKSKKVREFLNNGYRVKISLKFRGREIAKPDYGKKTLDIFFSYINDIAKIDKPPKLNGMFYDMYVILNKSI